LRFADDIDLLAEDEDHLQVQLTEVYQTAKDLGLHINRNKTKVIVMGWENSANIYKDGGKLDCVDQFIYLGSLITNNNDSSKEV
jgi:Reverse transcriptase (RNA-dependent DNA polymerase)